MKIFKSLFVFEVGGLDIIKEKGIWYIYEPSSKCKMSEGLSSIVECYSFVSETYGSFQILEEK